RRPGAIPDTRYAARARRKRQGQEPQGQMHQNPFGDELRAQIRPATQRAASPAECFRLLVTVEVTARRRQPLLGRLSWALRAAWRVGESPDCRCAARARGGTEP